ncbi:MAG TPA: sigma-70 family RNA polymerase sigma factor [Candidatus Baltobacteraceae bacterium]
MPTLRADGGLYSREMLSPDLVAAARGGGAADLDRLIEAAWPHAFRIALSIVRDRALAEDVAQEACAIVFRRVGRLRSVEAFGVWFYRIVLHEALALANLPRPLQLVENLARAAGVDETIDRIDILDALARLAPAQRAAIVLHYYARMNSREIAVVLGIPDSSVRFHLANARKRLERLLGDRREPTVVQWEALNLAT